MHKYKGYQELWNNQGKKIYQITSPKVKDCLIENESSYLSVLQLEKIDLNLVKSMLDPLDISLWHRHTSNTHRFSSLAYKLRTQIKAELPTQAWAKFYSILSQFNLVSSQKQFSSFHLCEAPGAFITSLNHFIRNNCLDCKLTWCATTLNPYYEGNDLGQMIPDDRFIINSLDCWDFGPDFTGNIMHPSSLEYFKDKFNDKEIDLITADGSIDCSDNPSEQEVAVAPLFLWEIITALNILSDKGSFVLKMFTFFEKCSIAFLYLITKVFDKVNLCKPGPSKPGNSEVYVVATGFNAELCRNLDLFHEMENAALTSADSRMIGGLIDISKISAPFINSLRDFVEESCSLQKEAIQKNLKCFERIDKNDQQNLNKIKEFFARKFIEEYQIEPIHDYISPMFAMMSLQGQYKNQKGSMNSKSGSFDQRTKTEQNASNGSACVMNTGSGFVLCYDKFEWKIKGEISRTLADLFSLDILQNFDPVLGKCLSQLKSSNYCAPLLLLTNNNLICTDWSSEKGGKQFIECLVNNLPDVVKIYCMSIDHKFTDSFTSIKNAQCIECKIDSVRDEIDFTGNEALVVDLPSKGTCKKDKIAMLTFVLNCFKFMETSQHVCFHFKGLLLSNFWAGVFFLISKLFRSVTYICCSNPSSHMVLILEKNIFNESDFKKLHNYFDRVLSVLHGSPSNKDVLHLVDLQYLMRSDFRKYLKLSNEHFINSFN